MDRHIYRVLAINAAWLQEAGHLVEVFESWFHSLCSPVLCVSGRVSQGWLAPRSIAALRDIEFHRRARPQPRGGRQLAHSFGLLASAGRIDPRRSDALPKVSASRDHAL